MTSRKFVKLFFKISISTIILAIATIFVLDPLHIFHKPLFKKHPYIHSDMRLQTAGIINSFEFDSIILGTSMLENTSATEASNKLGGKFANISLAGSDFYERDIILSYAYSKKDLKKVVYSIDMFYMDRTENDASNYIFLYDQNPINDFKLYATTDVFKYLRRSLLYKNSEDILEFPSAWFDKSKYNSTFGGIEKWVELKTNTHISQSLSSILSTATKISNGKTVSVSGVDKSIEKNFDYIDRYLIKNIKNHPSTKFIVVFPPYSRAYFAQWKQHDQSKFEIHKATIRYLAKRSSQLENMELYGFDDMDFLDDIANYRDLTHYHQKYNSMMLDSFANKDNLITLENVESYIEEIERKAAEYDLVGLADEIRRLDSALQ